MKRITLFLLVLILTGVALAATLDVMPPIPDLDLEGWARDSAAFAGVIAFVVYLVRTYVWRALDGDAVKTFSVILGALGGAALGLLTGFFDGNVISGIAHGLTAGVFSFIGVDAGRSILKTGKHAAPVALSGSNAGAFIVDFARSLVPANKLTRALEVLAPILKQFAGATLTDELRGELQGKVHTSLRRAGLIQGRDL